jgi:peroxisomal membrane protein 4
MFYHGRNLGSFVLIYKTVTLICRKFGISNGIECWIAGFIGGSTAFGNNKNLSGSVNNQIVLYLFARGLEAALNLATEKRLIPQILDVRKPTGFRIFAGFSLALILYMTEYRSNLLKPPFFRTMDHLYNESNSGSLHIPREYILFVFLISATLLIGDLFNIQQLKLDYILSQSENILQWFLDLLLGRPIDK